MVAAVVEEVAVEEVAATMVGEVAVAVAVEAEEVVLRTSLACSPQSEKHANSVLLPRAGSRRAVAAAALLLSNRMRV